MSNCHFCDQPFYTHLSDMVICHTCFHKQILFKCIKCKHIEVLNYNALCNVCNLYKNMEICLRCNKLGFLNNDLCFNCRLYGRDFVKSFTILQENDIL